METSQAPKLERMPEKETDMQISVPYGDDLSELQKAVTSHPALKSVAEYDMSIDHTKCVLVIHLRLRISRVALLARAIEDILTGRQDQQPLAAVAA
jgi:hypothetical protein